ncbi:hypothetical protein GCM10010124_22800 [Pilimelia terevasa]|uniref:Uncharacterized protein n=1 Tax=Pilimelia terevasa TaxID=53372 RepID=A0A8J3BPJ8_9ACTN|nr:hypothetical protein [Pilimelia terevasa]GGK29493.1 hypothetical protein GCM10010124_22800 [Pilimelia terevasa]
MAVAALTATAAAAGCDDGAAPAARNVAATGAPQPAPTGSGGGPAGGAALPAPGDPAATPGRLRAGVTLRRSGGFAAHDDTLAVGADGAWTFTSNRRLQEGRLTAARVDRLRDLLATPAFAAEAARVFRESCTDGLELTLTTGDRTVTWRDCGQAGRPGTAAAIVDQLGAWTPF